MDGAVRRDLVLCCILLALCGTDIFAKGCDCGNNVRRFGRVEIVDRNAGFSPDLAGPHSEKLVSRSLSRSGRTASVFSGVARHSGHSYPALFLAFNEGGL